MRKVFRQAAMAKNIVFKMETKKATEIEKNMLEITKTKTAIGHGNL